MNDQQAAQPRTFEQNRTSENILQRITAIRAPRLLRSMELALLVFSLIVGISAVLVIDLTIHGKVETNLLAPGILFVVLVTALHLVVRKVAPDADPLILPIAVFLNTIGIAMIYRIDLAEELSGWGSGAVRQLVWSSIAIAACIVLLLIIKNHMVLFRFTYLSGLGALVLLLLPMLRGQADQAA